jgi:predicted transcriptional regulator
VTRVVGDAGCGDDRPDTARAFIQEEVDQEIARDLKISRNTVRKILRSGETSFSYEREVQPRPKLGRWKADIDRMLTRNADVA